MSESESHTIVLPTVSPSGKTKEVPRLLVTGGPLEGREYEIKKFPYTIGSGLTNDLSIADSTVSRKHCEIIAEEDGSLTICDLNSTNGTSIEGVKVTSARLHPNTVVQLGHTRFIVPVVQDRPTLMMSTREQFGRSMGATPLMRHIFHLAEQAAACTSPVLILGESGSGKEELARDIHEESPRREAPYIVIDCNATPTIEAAKDELFGTKRSPGALELAGGGTLFIDSIDKLPEAAQPLLLRAVETRKDIRFITASKTNLSELAKEGTFSKPLFCALAVITIEMPALRRRRDDIPLLTRSIAERLQVSEEIRNWCEQPATTAFLRRYNWPGNIRELRSMIERIHSLNQIPADIGLFLQNNAPSADAVSTASDIGYQPDKSFKDLKSELIENFERKYLRELLARNAQNVSQSARDAGIERAYLQRLIHKYGMRD